MEFTLTREQKDTWSGIIAYQDANTNIAPEIDRRNLPVTGMTSKEARALEEELGYKTGTLSPESKFWYKEFFIPFKGILKLDDENPTDKLKLYVLRSMKKVAVGREQLKTKSKAIYLLTSKELETKTDSVKYDIKEQAWKLFLNASDTKLKQVAVVLEKTKVKGKVTDVSSMDIDSVKNKLRAELDRDPTFFVAIISDEDLATKFEVLELVTHRVLSTNASGYYQKSDLLGTTLDDMVVFMKDVHNQPRVIQLKQELKTKKGK